MIEYIKCTDGITREFDKWNHYGDWWCRNCSKLIPVRPEEHTCELTYKTLATKGRDRFGHYFNFTGYEGTGCFWCGKEIKKSRRYCCKEHQREYFKHFFWSDARDWCLARYDNTCQGCGTKDDLEVHHIDPVGNDGYGWHEKNRPENLIPLCIRCHGETRRKAVECKQEQLALF